MIAKTKLKKIEIFKTFSFKRKIPIPRKREKNPKKIPAKAKCFL